MRTVVRKGFLFARRNIVSRRQCLAGGRSLWWASGNQALPHKKAPRVTYEQNEDIADPQSKEVPHNAYEQDQDVSDRKSKEAPHITYEQKQDTIDRQSKEAPHIAYKQKQDASDPPLKGVPQITYEQKRDISKLVNSLPQRDMEAAFDIVRAGMSNLPEIMDHDLEIDIDKLPNGVLYSLLCFVRQYEIRSGDILRARRASAANSAALVVPVSMPTRCKTA